MIDDLKEIQNTQISFMSRALEVGRRGRARTSPNPNVGAVLVDKEGRVLGEGFTQPPGGPHAEVMALKAAAGFTKGSILYVTLEPCNRFGRTPPCTAAIIGAGVAEVHYAVPDPNPSMLGGAQTLKEAGIKVFEGECREEALEEHEAFFKWVKTGLPFVTVKYAMTLDGKIATRTGDSKWITGTEARQEVHRLRDDSDVIVTGVGTVIADDPELTVRLSSDELERRQKTARNPIRVVLDSAGNIPLSAQITNPGPDAKTIVATTKAADPQKLAALEKQKVEVLVLPAGTGKHVSLPHLLEELGKRGLIRVMVEAGEGILGEFISQKLADKVWAFIAPKIIGGESAPGPVGGEGPSLMADANMLQKVRFAHFGTDLLITGYL